MPEGSAHGLAALNAMAQKAIEEKNRSKENWKKYAQKRVHNKGVPEAVLKTSYECTVAGCIARKVTERDTHHDGPNGPLKLIFHAHHNHPISESLQAQMESDMATFDPSHTGGRLKRKSRNAIGVTLAEARNTREQVCALDPAE